MRELKVGDIVEHVHPGCYRDGGVGAIQEVEPFDGTDYWYHVRWIVAAPEADDRGEDVVRFTRSELTLRSEP